MLYAFFIYYNKYNCKIRFLLLPIPNGDSQILNCVSTTLITDTQKVLLRKLTGACYYYTMWSHVVFGCVVDTINPGWLLWVFLRVGNYTYLVFCVWVIMQSDVHYVFITGYILLSIGWPDCINTLINWCLQIIYFLL